MMMMAVTESGVSLDSNGKRRVANALLHFSKSFSIKKRQIGPSFLSSTPPSFLDSALPSAQLDSAPSHRCYPFTNLSILNYRIHGFGLFNAREPLL